MVICPFEHVVDCTFWMHYSTKLNTPCLKNVRISTFNLVTMTVTHNAISFLAQIQERTFTEKTDIGFDILSVAPFKGTLGDILYYPRHLPIRQKDIRFISQCAVRKTVSHRKYMGNVLFYLIFQQVISAQNLSNLVNVFNHKGLLVTFALLLTSYSDRNFHEVYTKRALKDDNG